MLYRALGYEDKTPTFAHLPLLLNDDKNRTKLSKRQGDVDVESYLRKGYLPEAILNFVVLLGWSPQAGGGGGAWGQDDHKGKSKTKSRSKKKKQKQKQKKKEKQEEDTSGEDFLSLHDMAERFSLDAVNKAGAVVSRQKLDSLNRRHLQRLCAVAVDGDCPGGVDGEESRAARKRLASLARPHLRPEAAAAAAASDERVAEVVGVLRQRLYTLGDLAELAPYFFEAPSVESLSLAAVEAAEAGEEAVADDGEARAGAAGPDAKAAVAATPAVAEARRKCVPDAAAALPLLRAFEEEISKDGAMDFSDPAAVQAALVRVCKNEGAKNKVR